MTCICCSKVLPLFSCKPPYRYKSLAVCQKEWLHAIEFDRIATPFSDQALNCTNILYCDELSKCVCTVRFWVCPDRMQLLSDLVEHPYLFGTLHPGPLQRLAIHNNIWTEVGARTTKTINSRHPCTVPPLTSGAQHVDLLSGQREILLELFFLACPAPCLGQSRWYRACNRVRRSNFLPRTSKANSTRSQDDDRQKKPVTSKCSFSLIINLLMSPMTKASFPPDA